MEKWLLGFGAQSLGFLRPHTLGSQGCHYRMTVMRHQHQNTQQENIAPLPDIMYVPWAPYLVGHVPVQAKMSSKAHGLFPQSREPFNHFLKNRTVE